MMVSWAVPSSVAAPLLEVAPSSEAAPSSEEVLSSAMAAEAVTAPWAAQGRIHPRRVEVLLGAASRPANLHRSSHLSHPERTLSCRSSRGCEAWLSRRVSQTRQCSSGERLPEEEGAQIVVDV